MNALRNSLVGTALSGVLVIAVAAPSLADSADLDGSVSVQVSKAAKLKKMRSITGNSSASQDRWFATLGKKNKASVKKYRFTWETDGCSWGPDKFPGGYDLKFPCWRHDFGYRNYKKTVGKATFRRDHKLRVDKAFLRDMNTVCGKHIWADPYTKAQRKKLRKACYKGAKKYYHTVRSFN
ncbi:phospholipase A2 [Streptomyces sp. NPDC059009]|uniref:phospholipase A2 n=1 Tax=Streptomyces sp. NPDC059009 TaxID=3346694 RepID=UPI0036831122